MTSRKLAFETMLGDVARQGFAHADAVLLRLVAERLWYGRSVPDLGKVPEPYRRDVGYLVDRLARFNVVKAGRKQKVLAALTPYKPSSIAEWQRHRDTLASVWGASAELTPRLAELLPYQTREYAEERKVKLKRCRRECVEKVELPAVSTAKPGRKASKSHAKAV